MFYVYTLSDPRDGKPFYVGKGKGGRASQHVKDARAGRISNTSKHQKILDILADGLTPIEIIIRRFDDEILALDFEARLIGTMPDLTNMRSHGSASPAAQVETKAEFKKRRSATAYLKNWLQKIKSFPQGVTFPGMPDGDAAATEFVAGIEWLIQAESLLEAQGILKSGEI